MSLYTTVFGLTHPPFQRALAADQLFRSPVLDELHSRLRYLVDSQALGLLTGEPGSGKSGGADFRRGVGREQLHLRGGDVEPGALRLDRVARAGLRIRRGCAPRRR